MPEFDHKTEENEEKEPFVPAGFEKRVAAWAGIVYMLMFLFIITFSLYRPGRTLAGTFPLFLVPVAVAAAVVTLYQQRRGTARGGLAGTIVMVLVCAAAAVIGLMLGVPALLGAFA